MEIKALIIVNCVIFLSLTIVKIDGSMFSILAYAALANLLRPRPKYLPPLPPPPPLPHPGPSAAYYDPLSQQSPYSMSSFQAPPSKRGFGFPGSGLSLDNNPVTDWAKSLKSHPESQKVPSFYGSYPSNGYQLINGPPPLRSTSLLMPKKSGVKPVFKLAGIADHFKSVPDKGLFQF